MQNHRSVRLVAIVAIASALVLGACGGGSDDEAETTDTTGATNDTADDTTTTVTSDSEDESDDEGGDGCDLFSDEVAAEVLGIEIVRREAHDDPNLGSLSCIKGTERVEDLSQGSYVSVGLVPNGGAIIDEFSSQEGSEAVSGVGDRAVLLASAGVLVFANGTDAIQIQVVKAGAPSGKEDLLTIAADVLDRLG